MKTKLLIITLSLSLGSICLAGPHGKHREHGNKDEFVQSLNLSEEQSVQFKTIMKNKRESMHAAMLVIEDDSMEQLEKILSTEQLQQFKDRKDRHAGRRLHRRSDK